MRENGHIRYKCTVNSEPIDEEGNPVVAMTRWSEYIPCLIRTAGERRNAVYADGEYRDVSMEILVESASPYCTCADSVEIERQGENLGEFRVVRTERLNTVGRVRILV